MSTGDIFPFNVSLHMNVLIIIPLQDFVCKIVLCVNLYATVSSINWMFIQGVYLHMKLTHVFDRGTPFKVYYAIGWGKRLTFLLSLLPFILCSVIKLFCTQRRKYTLFSLSIREVSITHGFIFI